MCVCVGCVYRYLQHWDFSFAGKIHISFFLSSFLSRVNSSKENLGFPHCFTRALKATRKMLQATFVSASWKLVPGWKCNFCIFWKAETTEGMCVGFRIMTQWHYVAQFHENAYRMQCVQACSATTCVVKCTIEDCIVRGSR